MTDEDNIIIPNGVGFRFIVKPSLSEKHKIMLRYLITKSSRLTDFYENILISFYDGCEVHEGLISSDDKLIGKQMVVKILCVKSTGFVPKDKEDYYYEMMESLVSEYIIEIIQMLLETKYKAELGAFLFEKRLLWRTNGT